MGFFDDILVENKPATPAADQTATAAQSPADLLIIDDSVSVASVPDTVEAAIVETPSDTFVSAFPEESAKDMVLFDEAPAVSEAEIKIEEDVPAEAPIMEALDTEPVAETVQPEAMGFIAEVSEPVVESKEVIAMAAPEVSDTMDVDVDATLKATIAQLEAGVANNDEKIQALKKQNEEANSEKERVLAEAKAESERILAAAEAAAAEIQEQIAAAETSIQNIESNGARAKDIIKKLTKEISA